MIITGLADIHGNLSAIDQAAEFLEKADAVLIAGDITDYGDTGQIKSVIDGIRLFNKNIFAVHGNCDTPAVQNYLEKENISIHRNPIHFKGITFAGLGGTTAPPMMSLEEDSYEYDTFADYLDILGREIGKDKPFIFVSHQGAWQTEVAGGIGSLSIRKFIDKYSPILALSGHSHDAVGVENLNGSILANPGPLRKGKIISAEICEKTCKVLNCQVKQY